jgi:hypothetical protein
LNGATSGHTSGETTYVDSREESSIDTRKEEMDSHAEDEQLETEEKIEKISQHCWTKGREHHTLSKLEY